LRAGAALLTDLRLADFLFTDFLFTDLRLGAALLTDFLLFAAPPFFATACCGMIIRNGIQTMSDYIYGKQKLYNKK